MDRANLKKINPEAWGVCMVPHESVEEVAAGGHTDLDFRMIKLAVPCRDNAVAKDK